MLDIQSVTLNLLNGQVNGKANNEDNVPAFGKLILQNNNNNKEKVLKII